MRVARRGPRLAAVLAAVSAVLLPAAVRAQTTGCSTGVIQAPAGGICGILTEAAGEPVAAYKGIPYAEPPVGELRWKPPVPKAAWSETFMATTPGAMCPQKVSDCPMRGNGQLAQDEDCLYLNLWVPADPSRPPGGLPVMVFIHGGTFLTGSGALPLYDGAHLAATGDLIVVTLNYRLGALGGLMRDDLVGNYGIRDQILALQWVQENISSFGGDPGKVTIFGQSAGAMSVSLHLLSSPRSAGLFRAALMESAPLALPYHTPDEAHELGELFTVLAGCLDLDCLRQKSVEELVTAENKLLLELPAFWQGLGGLLVWTPVIDGSLLVKQPYAAAAAGKLVKPVLLGTNQAEADLFVLKISWEEYLGGLFLAFGDHAPDVLERYPIAWCGFKPCDDQGLTLSRLATDYLWTCGNRKVATFAKKPLYAYQFTQRSSFDLYDPQCTPICREEVCHGEELPYVFDTLSALDVHYTPAEQELSELVMAYWTAFGADEDPNRPGRFPWPAFAGEKNTLDLRDEPTSVEDPFAKLCAFWDWIGYDLGSPWSSLRALRAAAATEIEEVRDR